MLNHTRILVLALFFALTASGARAEYAYLVLQGKGAEQDRILRSLHGPGVTIVYDHLSRNLLLTRQETIVADGPAELWKTLQPQANSYALLELVRISGAVIWFKGMLGGGGGYSGIIDHRVSTGVTAESHPLAKLMGLVASVESNPMSVVHFVVGEDPYEASTAHFDMKIYFNGETKPRLKFSVTGTATDTD